MSQLSDLAIKAILKEWRPQTYWPPHTDVTEWIRSIESLCNLYGIPDSQRLRCAVTFVKKDIGADLQKVLEDAGFVPLHWNLFRSFLVYFDRDFRKRWEELPFYKKHPKRTAVAAGIVGGIVLTPVAVGALSYLGLTTAGFAAGSAAFSYQSLVYSTATRVVLVSLQSAGTTGAVMPSVGTILTGAATTGTGALVAATNTKSVTSTSGELLKQAAESIVHDEKLGDDNESPPPYNATAPEEYHLTPRAIIAIVKSWNIQTYNPPRTKCSTWLSDVHNLCEQYEIPTSQQASCAMHHMRNDCHEAAINAGCCNMTWDEFAMWLRQYDHQRGTSANGKFVGLLAEKSKM